MDQKAPETAPRGGRSLRQAVATALVLLALVAICYALGTTAFFVLIAAVVLLALFELLSALRSRGRRPNIAFGLAAGFALLLVAFLDVPRLLIVVFAFTTYGALFLALLPGRSETPASDAAWTLLGIAWIAGGGAAAVSIMMIDRGGLNLLIAYVFIVALDDIGAYFAGVSFGRHKMAPAISPGKSWEGFAGGLAAALVGGLVFGSFLRELTPLHGLAVAAIAGVLAPVGDLAESLFKREIGIKDSGTLLPGHGGFLDRLDAIVFCAPAAALYLRLALT